MANTQIALTASMRSNLLSLKNTQRLFDKTQDHLSTGYKVNSAMDNPSSYFTAQALNARANDLSTLLDSIGQAVSTLETADEGITTLQKFVEQAKSIANSARDTANVASKVTSDNVTFNPATAKTDLLSDIMPNIADGDKFTIRLGDATKMEGTSNIATDQTLTEAGLATGMKFDMIVGDKTYSFEIAAAASGPTTNSTTGAIEQKFAATSTVEDFMKDIVYTVGRKVLNAEVKDGKLSFNTLDNSSLVIRSTADVADPSGKTFAAATTDLSAIFGTAANNNDDSAWATAPEIDVDGVAVDISSFVGLSDGLITDKAGVVSAINAALKAAGKDTIVQLNSDGVTMEAINKASPTTEPVITITDGVTADDGSDAGGGFAGDAAVTTGATAPQQTNFNKVLGFDEGFTVTYTDGMSVEKFRQAINDLEGVSADFDSKGKMIITGEQGDDMVIADQGGSLAKSLLGKSVVGVTNGSNERKTYATQFDAVLNQIDQLVQDTSYKGINLLKGDDLTVVFNESRTSTLQLKGVTFDSKGLGFTAADAEWKTNESIDKALNQLSKATSLLRAQASEFGQNLSTVQIRADFTENMVNNLTVGADKLTLADMNEEAANMLALQTRQQLGTNSLSLASQAAQSVLKLF